MNLDTPSKPEELMWTMWLPASPRCLEYKPRKQAGKTRLQVTARSLLCYWAVRELGESMTAMARRIGLSTAEVSKAVVRGAEIADKNGYRIFIS
jgi:hypothetical protein